MPPAPRLGLLVLALVLGLPACGSKAPGGARAAGGPRARALLSELPAAFRGADLANGAAEFSLCRSCHTVAAGGADMTGPNLFGVFGRPLAGRSSYAYSTALRSRGGVWSADRLAAWVAAPSRFAPGTKMTFPGIRAPTDRRDLIAYLKLVSNGAADGE